MQSRIILFLLLTSFVFKTTAQETISPEGDTITFPFKRIMVVPFEENMFISGIQNELIQSSGKSHHEIIQFFRFGIAASLQYEFLFACNTTSLIHYRDTTHDLDRTYAGVYYKFEPYAEEIKNASLNSTPKKEGNKESSSKVKDGQVISSKKTQEKFASLYLKDTTILNFLNQKYAADLFVFITQLNIENDLSDQLALATDTYIRFLKAHYAIVDLKGNFIAKGVVSTDFPNTVNTMEEIQKNYFPKIANLLMQKLPKIVKKKVPLAPEKKGKKEKTK